MATLLSFAGRSATRSRVAAEDIYVDGKDSSRYCHYPRSQNLIKRWVLIFLVLWTHAPINDYSPKRCLSGFIKIDETGELVKAPSQHVEDSLQELLLAA